MGSSILNEKLKQGIEVTIVGDNDFYSQRAQVIFFLRTFFFLPLDPLSSFYVA
jgi:hypothetical protein